MAATLSKEERLSSRTAISDLMGKGRWGHHGHFKYCSLKEEGSDVNRIMVSVPKKFFKRAVGRNLLKRRIREAYRTQKGIIDGSGISLMFLYNSPEAVDYATIRTEVADILEYLKHPSK